MSNQRLKEIQKGLQLFRDLEKAIVKLAEEIGSKRTQQSYNSQSRLDSVFGAPMVNASHFSLQLDEEIFRKKSKLDQVRLQLLEAIEQLQISVEAAGKGERLAAAAAQFPVDVAFLHSVVNQIQQQVAVETLALEKIVDFDDPSVDHDLLVTLIATFKYSPYLRQADIDLVLGLGGGVEG